MPVAICLLICMFNGSVPIIVVQGLDSTVSSSEAATSPPEVTAFPHACHITLHAEYSVWLYCMTVGIASNQAAETRCLCKSSCIAHVVALPVPQCRSGPVGTRFTLRVKQEVAFLGVHVSFQTLRSFLGPCRTSFTTLLMPKTPWWTTSCTSSSQTQHPHLWQVRLAAMAASVVHPQASCLWMILCHCTYENWP